MSIKSLLLGAACASLLGCASPREMLGWPADVPFVITPAEAGEFATSAPLSRQRLDRVTFSAAKVYLTCGDFSDTNGIGIDHIGGRIGSAFPALLRQQLQASTLFTRGAPGALSLRATLTDLTQDSSVGAAAERRSLISSGAVLTTRVQVRYELLDGDQIVGRWDVTTTARSNSLAASTRLSENIDGALKRNLRALLLQVVADHSPQESARAKQSLAGLHSEVDNKRIALAYLVYGTTKTVSTTAGVVGDGLVAVSQNSEAISAGLNATANTMERNQRDYNMAQTQAMLAGRSTTSAPTSAAPAHKRAEPAKAAVPVVRVQETADARAPGRPVATTAAPRAAVVARAETAPREEPVPKTVKPKAVEWGPKRLEAIAICRQSTKSRMWTCNGALDNQTIVDEPTLEGALARQHCAAGEFVKGGPQLEGVQWNAYRCGHSLGHGDYDVVKRHGLGVVRRSYICPLNEPGNGRCETPYSGQDKAS